MNDDAYIQPGEKIQVVGPFHLDRPYVIRAVVVERIPERDALGPRGAAFHYRDHRHSPRDAGNLYAALEHFEGTHWIRGWTREAHDALLAARALAALPIT